ncbi:hypothetical protein [Burkholderia sp. b13]|nr:hypothetical protein [Burkholderia sp. b13]
MATMAFGVTLLFAFGSYTRRRIAGTRLDATVKPPSRHDCIEPARSAAVPAPHGRPSNAARRAATIAAFAATHAARIAADPH